jgi:hypothetical protein
MCDRLMEIHPFFSSSCSCVCCDSTAAPAIGVEADIWTCGTAADSIRFFMKADRSVPIEPRYVCGSVWRRRTRESAFGCLNAGPVI